MNPQPLGYESWAVTIILTLQTVIFSQMSFVWGHGTAPDRLMTYYEIPTRGDDVSGILRIIPFVQ